MRSAHVTKIVFLVEQRKNWTALVEDSQPRFWDAAHRWESTDWLLRADFMLLLFMLVNTGAILILSLYRYRYAARQVRAFIREIASALHEGKLQNVIAIGAEIDRRHFASGIGDSVRAYASTPPHFSHREAVEFAQRAYQRRSRWITASLEEGLGTLSMITSSATFLGFLGTVYGIVHTFRGTSGSKAAALSRIAAELAIAVLLGAMGLLASVLALWCLNYLRRRLEVVQGRVSNAYLDVVERLNAHPEWRELLRELFVAKRSIPSDFAPMGGKHPMTVNVRWRWRCGSAFFMWPMLWLTTRTGLGYYDDHLRGRVAGGSPYHGSASSNLNQFRQDIAELRRRRAAEFEVDFSVEFVQRCIGALRCRLRFVDGELGANFVLCLAD